ncbi:glycerol-3-phosphate 1-O-acyltransferase PlsY [Candidatus Sumerlaeota bacterium]|nr:glycerol-3-phosphate 1-O-acyltransferase PlsY [Candidatus Sumerlaeota bacterium]
MISTWILIGSFSLAAFLLGGVPFAFILVKKIRGIDIRTVGSGNVGASNAKRVLGWPMGILILILDILKGVVAAWALPWIMDTVFQSASASILNRLGGTNGMGLCLGLVAFLGHCYSPFLRFKGGKGVATALGVYLVVAPKAALLTLVVCLAIVLATRMVSLASVTGAVLLPAAILAFGWQREPRPWVVFAITSVLSLIVILRHRSNVRRLLKGTEHKI